MEDHFIIAIDGPAGAGKSTIAKSLSKKLEISYLDTGAMYRSLTFKAMAENVNMESEVDLVELANRTVISFAQDTDGLKVLLDDKDVSAEIRTVEVTNNTFYIARAPRVREIMVKRQQEIGSQQSVVAEGRDITTVVFPDADYKFYLDANLDERSNRRLKELQEKGKDVDPEVMTEEIKNRDHKDFSREVGALKIAKDAIVIDSTGLTIEGVTAEILKHVK